MLLLRPKVTFRRPPQQERARFTVDAILEAGARIVIERGVDALRMAELAEVAGVSPGTMYQYFPDRDFLLNALLDRLAAPAVDALDALLADRSDGTLEALLETAARSAVQAVVTLRPLRKALQPHYFRLAQEGGLQDRSEEAVEKLARAIAARLQRPEADVTAAARGMIFAAEGLLAGSSRLPEPPGADELIRHTLGAWDGILRANGLRR